MLFRIWQATYFASRTLFSLRLPSPSISTTDAGLGRDDSRAGGPQLKIAPSPSGRAAPEVRRSPLAPLCRYATWSVLAEPPVSD